MSGAMAGLTGGGAADPTAGAASGGDTDAGTPEDNVILSVCSDGQGGYLVFSGDEPEGGGGAGDDGSEDDADLMGPAGDQPAGGNGGAPESQGQPAPDWAGVMRIVATMDPSQGGGGPAGSAGSADAQFASGFGGGQGAAPTMAQKF